jgi:hypothetical protein
MNIPSLECYAVVGNDNLTWFIANLATHTPIRKNIQFNIYFLRNFFIKASNFFNLSSA